MSSRQLKVKDKIIISVTSIAWVFLFANIGKQYIEPQIVGEIVGIVCGISVSFTSLYIYRKLLSFTSE